MNSSMFLAILLMAAVTFLTRWLPFAAFRPGQPIPKTIAYLGQVLPLAMMAMLVVYGLRSTDWLGSNHGLPGAFGAGRDPVLFMAGSATVCSASAAARCSIWFLSSRFSGSLKSQKTRKSRKQGLKIFHSSPGENLV